MEENNRADVLELQKYLRILYRAGYDIPSILPNGIFGEGTREAVYKLQGLFSLDTTGKVDLDTWNAIVKSAAEGGAMFRRAEPIYPFSQTLAGKELQKGDLLSLVAIVKIMLKETLIYGAEELVVDNLFDTELEQVLKRFQKANRIEESGRLDRATWDLLAKQYNAFSGHPDASL